MGSNFPYYSHGSCDSNGEMNNNSQRSWHAAAIPNYDLGKDGSIDEGTKEVSRNDITTTCAPSVFTGIRIPEDMKLLPK